MFTSKLVNQSDRADKVKALYALSLEQRQATYNPRSESETEKARWHEATHLRSLAFAGLTKTQRGIVNELRKEPQGWDWIDALSNIPD